MLKLIAITTKPVNHIRVQCVKLINEGRLKPVVKLNTAINITGVRCSNCLDVIYSRATHDYRSCSCRKTSIDGGLQYTKIIGSNYKTVNLKCYISKSDLYADWNTGLNRFGLIHIERHIQYLYNKPQK